MGLLRTSLLLTVCVAGAAAFGGGRGGGTRVTRGPTTAGRRGQGGKGWMNHGNGDNTTAAFKPVAYKIPAGFVKMNNTQCDRSNRMQRTKMYHSMATAMAACKKNTTCSGVQDYACRGRFFSLCDGGKSNSTSGYRRGYGTCLVQKKADISTTKRPTSTCDKTIATRVCKNVKLDLCPNGVCKDQRTEHTLCTTPCAKYLTANMYACSVGITKDAIGTPDTELYLASVDKYCSKKRRGKGSRRGGKGTKGGKGKKGGKGATPTTTTLMGR